MSTPRTPPKAEPSITIGDRQIGPQHPTFVIAELSGNHRGELEAALELVEAAADAGADAVKLQTYTADTLTIDASSPPFVIGEGTPWAGRTLHELYQEATTPWEWYPDLAQAARRRGLEIFSTPFDRSATDFLRSYDPPAYKIASFELVDLELISYVAEQGKPLIMSTGMATVSEIDRAVDAAQAGGADGVVLLRCNSAYPAPIRSMDLRTIEDMRARWPAVIGLSDHSLGLTAAVTSVALGAKVIEKHLTRVRAEGGPDASFSLEPVEFAALVVAVRETEDALGTIRYGPTADEGPSLVFRRSLFVVEDIGPGEELTRRNVRSIRPGDGLAPRFLEQVLGRRASRPLTRGTPLSWALLEDGIPGDQRSNGSQP